MKQIVSALDSTFIQKLELQTKNKYDYLKVYTYVHLYIYKQYS